MSPGPHLSHAARLGGVMRTIAIRVVLHWECAGVRAMPEAAADLAEFLDFVDAFAAETQRIADDFGHREVARRFFGIVDGEEGGPLVDLLPADRGPELLLPYSFARRVCQEYARERRLQLRPKRRAA